MIVSEKKYILETSPGSSQDKAGKTILHFRLSDPLPPSTGRLSADSQVVHLEHSHGGNVRVNEEGGVDGKGTYF